MDLRLSVYTVLHFLIDLSCIYFLLSTAAVGVPDHSQWLLLVLAYNFLAFAFPAVIGSVADLMEKNLCLAAAGCLLVSAAFLFRMHLTIAVVLLGAGNGFFHIGCGRQVLEESQFRYTPCGIFISSGAVGVWLGRLWGGQHMALYPVFLSLMTAGAVILCFMYAHHQPVSTVSDSVGHTSRDSVLTGAALFFLSAAVVLRSLFGTLTQFEWNTGFRMGLCFVLCVAGGKFFGGVLADGIGVRNAACASLAGAGILSLLSFSQPVFGLCCVFLFNMTMPMGLILLYRNLPSLPGFSFGLLMMSLFLGTLPGLLHAEAMPTGKGILFAVCLVSFFLFAISGYIMRKRGRLS